MSEHWPHRSAGSRDGVGRARLLRPRSLTEFGGTDVPVLTPEMPARETSGDRGRVCFSCRLPSGGGQGGLSLLEKSVCNPGCFDVPSRPAEVPGPLYSASLTHPWVQR